MKITQIKENCLYINSLDQAEGFYHEKLGLPIISKVEDNHIFFRAGSSVLLCFLPNKSKNQEVPPPHYAHGKQHMAFEVAAKDYEQAKAFLASKAIPITYEHQWPHGKKSAYFEDLEGHVLEIVPSGLWGD